MAKPTVPEPVFLKVPQPGIHFDGEAFDAVIRAHGVRLRHLRGMRCPVGMADPDDGRRPHPDHEGCANGYLYTPAGVVTALLQGNRVSRRESDIGVLDSSAAELSLPRTYDGVDAEAIESQIYVQPGDRFYLDDEAILVVGSETLKATQSGTDRLVFPAVRIQDLIDDGGRRYAQGVDFDLVEGRLRWRAGKMLAGGVYSVRFMYRPYLIVQEITHALRIGHIPGTDGTKASRFPQACLVRREFVLAGSSANDPLAKNPADPNQALPPQEQ